MLDLKALFAWQDREERAGWPCREGPLGHVKHLKLNPKSNEKSLKGFKKDMI